MPRLLALLLLCTLFTGCTTNPVTGKSELSLVSQPQEIAIGEQQYLPAQQSQGGVYTVDDSIEAYVQEVGSRLAAVSDSALPYEFTVINDSTPNAWALPGGKIAVNRGLLTSLDNEAELAAVLGHEIVHAAARHGAQSISRSVLLQGAVMAAAIGASDSEYANYITGGAALGSQLISQRYGREAELESDYYGMLYMARAGYDPTAAITLQEKFVELSKGRETGWLDGLFASHPPSAQRVERNIETNRQLRLEMNRDWEVGEARYAAAIAPLVKAAPAYAAFDQALALARTKEVDAALGRIDQAIRLEPREPRFYGLKGGILFNDSRYREALKYYDQALARDQGYFEYYLGRGLTYARLNDRARARADLEQSNNLLPTALAANELGGLALAEGDRDTAKRYFYEAAQGSGSLAQVATASYVKLDVTDNPDRYFQLQPALDDGNLVAVITNGAGLDIRSATVLFSAVINGVPAQAQVNLGPLAAGGQRRLLPGFRLSASDVVDELNIRVVDVSL